MDIIKRKISLEDLTSREQGLTYGTITASTIYLKVYLSQNIDDMGIFTDVNYIPHSSLTPTEMVVEEPIIEEPVEVIVENVVEEVIPMVVTPPVVTTPVVLDTTLDFTVSPISEVCFGGTDTITVTRHSGNPYEYKLNNGSWETENGNSEHTFNNVGGGEYIISVRNESGMEAQGSSYIIEVPEMFNTSYQEYSGTEDYIYFDGSGGYDIYFKIAGPNVTGDIQGSTFISGSRVNVDAGTYTITMFDSFSNCQGPTVTITVT
jgi:hypothetical protein